MVFIYDMWENTSKQSHVRVRLFKVIMEIRLFVSRIRHFTHKIDEKDYKQKNIKKRLNNCKNIPI